jgi:hypothetical protein
MRLAERELGEENQEILPELYALERNVAPHLVSASLMVTSFATLQVTVEHWKDDRTPEARAVKQHLRGDHARALKGLRDAILHPTSFDDARVTGPLNEEAFRAWSVSLRGLLAAFFARKLDGSARMGDASE